MKHSAIPVKWIQAAHIKKGALTKEAARHGETVKEFEKEVEHHPEHYSAKTKKRVVLAETLAKLSKHK